MIEVSCIIPTCDRQEYLEEAVDCMVRQSYAALEIIVVNNGYTSIDLDKHKASNISVIEAIPYCGVSQARNLGAVCSKGNVLAFLDDDDLWEKDYLEKMVSEISTYDVVLSRLDRMQGDQISRWKDVSKSNLDIEALFMRNLGVTGSNIVITKDCFFKIGGFDPRLTTSEDKSLIIEALLRGVSIKPLTNAQSIHRHHEQDNRLSGSESMVVGMTQFVSKYEKIMSIRTKLWIHSRIVSHKIRLGNRLYIPVGFIYRALIKFRIIP